MLADQVPDVEANQPRAVDVIFDGHDAGLRQLRQHQGKRFRARSRTVPEAIKAAEAILKVCGPEGGRRAARNLVLSSHHRGENDRDTEFLDLRYVAKRVEAMRDLCDADDGVFATELARALQPKATASALISRDDLGAFA